GVGGGEMSEGLGGIEELLEGGNGKGEGVICEIKGEMMDINMVKDGMEEIKVKGENEVGT
ncbi:hypothetical protein, partial [Macrococcoides caseolyticum]|uniref:hypothetical protein n=1 Tax=Macrococcoides caseolyticum TaxID=69966 RepID=UPI001C92EBD9